MGGVTMSGSSVLFDAPGPKARRNSLIASVVAGAGLIALAVWVFLILAALNELVWRTQSTEAWVWFKTFGLTAALFAFFMTQGKLFQEHGIEKKEDGGA